MRPQTRARLITLHRWTAIVLLPIYVALLVTGAWLALKPISDGAPPKRRSARVPVEALTAVLARLQAEGDVKGVSLALDASTATVTVGQERRNVSLETGAVIPSPTSASTRSSPNGPPVPPVDKYAIPRAIHIRLWFGAGVVVAVATVAMLVLVVLGPFLSPPRYRNTALGWHTTAGWFLFPLMLFLPLTGAILVAPFLQPKRELLAPTNRLPQPVSVAEGLAIASKSIDLGELRSIQQMPNGRLMIQTQGTMLTRLYVVSPEAVEAIGGTLFTAATMVHKGAWLGAWSGVVNLLGAVGLTGLLSTGTWSWVRRLRLRRRRRSVAVGKGSETLLPEGTRA